MVDWLPLLPGFAASRQVSNTEVKKIRSEQDLICKFHTECLPKDHTEVKTTTLIEILPLMPQAVFLTDDHKLCGWGQSRSWSS